MAEEPSPQPDPSASQPDPSAAAADPMAMLRSTAYLRLLVLAAAIGVPVSAVAYGFLKLVNLLQTWIFTSLPKEIGFSGTPAWWPLPLLAVAGVLVGATILYLPGTAGHVPAEGFTAGGPPAVEDLPGVVIAALATLSLGVVLGPEAPLIAIGGGLGALTIRLAARDAPPTAALVMASAGSFAAISTLFGSPLLGAFLLMEAAGIGGPVLGLLLVPGLLAAGIGTLIFVGLDSLTGFGTFSLSLTGLPPFHHLTIALFLWAIVFGLVASVLGTCIRMIGLTILPLLPPRRLVLTPLLGVAVAGLAIGFAEITGRSFSWVLFSGQSALPGLVQHAAGWSVGALALLVVCKSVAYGLSLSGFRGGPVFPAMFVGAAAGIAASHLPGMSLIPGIAMGIGAMATVMLKLPLTSTMLPTLLLFSDGIQVLPVVIVAVVVAYVASAWLPETPADLKNLKEKRGPTATDSAPASAEGSGP